MNTSLIKDIERKKIKVDDFIYHFRDRYKRLSFILQQNKEVKNVFSINKIPKEKESLSIIGIVNEKRITKKGNLIFSIEDLTGSMKVVVPFFKKDIFDTCLDVSLDSVVCFVGNGNNEVLFADRVIFPGHILEKRKKSKNNELALFIGNLYFGGSNFMMEEFLQLIKYLSEETKENIHVKYLFITGNLVSGIGVYPGQEDDLVINNLEEQFLELSKLLGKIRKDIQIIISPGVHDGVSLFEPQPQINKKYIKHLQDLKNVILVENPDTITIGKTHDFEGFDVLMYYGLSFDYYVNSIESLIKLSSLQASSGVMKYVLENRHLAPDNNSSYYIPSKRDSLVIEKVPDVFVSSYGHASSISYSNNVLLISTSSWERKKRREFDDGSDFCQVPCINLKTREVKLLDFENENQNN